MFAAALFSVAIAAPAMGGDVEVDPFALMLGGSLHAGVHRGPYRLSLGVYSLALPVWVPINPGFTTQVHGVGLMGDRFFSEDNTGLHVGLQAHRIWQLIHHRDSGLADLHREVALGARVGWRLQHESGFYVDPWLGVLYRPGAETEVTLDGDTYRQPAFLPVPTLHTGYRF